MLKLVAPLALLGLLATPADAMGSLPKGYDCDMFGGDGMCLTDGSYEYWDDDLCTPYW